MTIFPYLQFLNLRYDFVIHVFRCQFFHLLSGASGLVYDFGQRRFLLLFFTGQCSSVLYGREIAYLLVKHQYVSVYPVDELCKVDPCNECYLFQRSIQDRDRDKR